MAAMDSIKRGDTGAAVEDVQERLALLGLLATDAVSGVFDDATVVALAAFCQMRRGHQQGVGSPSGCDLPYGRSYAVSAHAVLAR